MMDSSIHNFVGVLAFCIWVASATRCLYKCDKHQEQHEEMLKELVSIVKSHLYSPQDKAHPSVTKEQ